MKELIKNSLNDLDSAMELRELVINKINSQKLTESDIIEIVDTVDDLSFEDTQKLGSIFRRFPLGCDLLEIGVGPCSSSLTLPQFIENCVFTDHMGFPIHLCGYALADIAEKEGLTPIEVMNEVYNNVEVPLDLDHFGRFGPMRFPKEISHCMGDCYYNGPPYKGCPRDRIHKRLITKEREYSNEFGEWIKKSSTVCVNVVEEQGGGDHGADISEMEDVANAAQKFGRGVEGIFHIGDGYEDLITGLKACNDLDVDVLVIEGGPFNRSKDRLKDFAKSVAVSRILVKGGVVATNGAYEDECRVGLRSGLNVILSGFSGNHHGYMCGYNIKEARRNNFGLPRVLKIMKEEAEKINICIANRELLKVLARSSRFLNHNENHLVYPSMIGDYFIGDAHWVSITNSKMYNAPYFGKTLDSLEEELNCDKVGVLGGRYLSWGIADALKPEELYVSDVDPWVEHATVKILNDNGINAYACNGNDKKALESAEKSVITTMIPEIVLRIKNKFDAVSLL
ncbi:5,10-methenyltetrahydromethanopterin hydrogenase cofactor biosynthesis protein HmdC [Methanococcus maripaludis]|uniref:5,10-methenyltetrahydromethanopterin hydrogenase cofactor biosynthesis protein HmdC n=1 Tax=Methanococcus maripaludis TaxID=39152 RepID=A0A7J9NXG2_METMI|nr:5,10-methenyltetrahydromethanopterin hydrogenase cofactor biosynthesis protein HmdC [Methanococcus maripaludis]MBA2851971.1 5,10-methenyltetrahydromethanopterin hydrogenase cofactor biosynthesis protein HmdC [Methanococcus maripaludis]